LVLLSIHGFANSISTKLDYSYLDGTDDYVNSSDFFIGKWKVQVYATPNGDVIMNLDIKKVNDIYIGSVQTDGSGPQPITADKIEFKNNELKIYWLAGGYNVYLQLEKVEENIIEGSLMDMFDAKGERLIE